MQRYLRWCRGAFNVMFFFGVLGAREAGRGDSLETLVVCNGTGKSISRLHVGGDTYDVSGAECTRIRIDSHKPLSLETHGKDFTIRCRWGAGSAIPVKITLSLNGENMEALGCSVEGK